MITIKKGETFSYTIQYEPDEGDPSTLEDYEISSQIRDLSGTLISQVTVSPSDDFLSVECVVADTSEWSLGTLYWDISFRYQETTSYTETIKINVERGITVWPSLE